MKHGRTVQPDVFEHAIEHQHVKVRIDRQQHNTLTTAVAV